MFTFRSVLYLACLALACDGVVGRNTAPSGALVVGKTGHYSTIQKAVNALSTSSSSAQSIFIQPGTYQEQVYIQKLAGPLTIYGSTSEASSYTGNQVTITASHALSGESNDDATATLRVWTSNFKMYNVNVKNTYGYAAKNGQALALSASAKDQGYYGCGFYGYQDTVLAETGTQLYAKCYLEGSVDFIFGQTAQAWFDSCHIGVLATSSYGTVTASGRTSADSGYYVINNSTIAAASGQSVAKGSYYLGRPWGDYARVIFQLTSMTNVINPAGWIEWSSSSPQTDHVTFGEYDDSGDGAKGTRASFATKLSEPVSITKVLGSGYEGASWVDTSYIS